MSLARTGAARNHLARGSDGTLAPVLAEESTRVVFADRGYVLAVAGSLFSVSSAEYQRHAQQWSGTRMYLGQDRATDTDYVGVGLDAAGRNGLDGYLDQYHAEDAEALLDAPAAGTDVTAPRWFNLGSVALEFDDLNVGLATTLVSLHNWHLAHTHSPRNGLPTEPTLGGWVRTEPSTGSEHFPRTDPAVIMAVIHTDESGEQRLLLGNNANWEDGRYSVLAGFVEPGETLERAVVREVFEEAGVHCHSPRYVGSQPWPFPCSLMLGFFATADTLTERPDHDEMSKVTWVTREELRDGIADGRMWVPGEVSIAGQIIQMWLHGATA